MGVLPYNIRGPTITSGLQCRDRERERERIRNEILALLFLKELDDPKRAKKQQEAAEREAQRLIKNFKEIQRKADKKSKKKEKDIEQEIRKMEVGGREGSFSNLFGISNSEFQVSTNQLMHNLVLNLLYSL